MLSTRRSTSSACFEGAEAIFLSQSVAGLGQMIQPAPEQPIDSYNEEAHDRYAKDETSPIVGGGRRRRNVGAEAGSSQSLIAPLDYFRDDARVPRATRCGDGAGYPGGKD